MVPGSCGKAEVELGLAELHNEMQSLVESECSGSPVGLGLGLAVGLADRSAGVLSWP